LTGAALVSPCFALLVRDPSVLGSAALPAPSAMVWAGVARALASGAAALEPTARTAGLCGLLLGALLTVLERLLPPRLARLVPSPTGLGVALVMPAWNALALFLGSALGAAYSALRPAGAARTLAPLASGLIAGESLIGIALALAFAARSSP